MSCNSSEKKSPEAPKDSPVAKKKDTAQAKTKTPASKPPIINIVDSVAPKHIVVYMKDSSATFAGINLKLAQIFGKKLNEVYKKNGLKSAGAPIAWYSTHKAPYFFEAGIPVNKKPTKLTPGIKVKEIPADSVVIAHFFGPYDQLNVGYDVIRDWLKEHNRRSTGQPYEVYIGDPLDKKGKPNDPYKIQTDIVFPRK
ncbi:MAG TPA: GyrI-like domain-containing protein [Ferruginibacter sp.]|nr:GyrI-like domain-containing protein [Ferruginibacter sp.]